MKFDLSVQEVVDAYLHMADRWDESRTDSLLCYNFCMNKQWTDKEIAYLIKTGRAPLVYNMITPRLHNLYGTEQLSRRSTKIRPSGEAHKGTASVLNGLWRSIWETKYGEFELEKTFLDGLICKIPGIFKVGVVVDEYGFMDYNFSCRNPFAYYFDPEFRRSDLKDCKYLAEEGWLTIAQITDAFGMRDDYAEYANSKSWIQDIVSGLKSLMGAGDDMSKWHDKHMDMYKVIELQRREKVKRALMFSPETKEYYFVEPSKAKDDVDRNKSVYVSESAVDRIRITTAIPYFNITVVDEIDKMDCDMYNVIPYFSFDYNNIKSQNNSLVYAMIDPQRNLNKREIQKTNYIDHSINSPNLWSYEDKEAKEAMDSAGNRPGLNILVRNMKFPPKKLAPNTIGMDIWNDIADSVSKMNDISGITEAVRGQSEYANESARLHSMKIERAGATLNPYFRNLSKTRKMIAEYFLKTVGIVYSQEARQIEVMDRKKNISTEMINIHGENGTVKNDVRSFEGRVILDEAEYSPTQLQENMQTKLVLAQMMPPEFVYWEYILQDMELPDIERWIEFIASVRGVQSEQAAMQQALAENSAVLQEMQAEQALANPQVKE